MTELSSELAPMFLTRIRRHHALEHATIHLLSQQFPATPLIGRSDPRGFYLLGDVPTEALRKSIHKALDRLRSGDAELAIHPNCGTNLVVTALLVGGTSYLTIRPGSTGPWWKRVARLPFAIATTALALLAAPIVGRAAQRHLTTSSAMGNLDIASIRRMGSGRTTLHRVRTHDG